MHAVEVGNLGGPYRRGVQPVGIAELRVDPFASATRHVLCETKMPQHADAVRLQREAGADLGQRGGLLVDADLNVALVQRIGGS